MFKSINSDALEKIVGFLVLLIASYFCYTAYNNSNLKSSKTSDDHYKIIANFDNISGLSIGGDIRVSGVKVGSISDIKLSDDYLAHVTMVISSSVRIPTDSSFEVVSSSLLGEKYIEIYIGNEDHYIKNNEIAQFTASSIILEKLISKFVFSDGDKKYLN